MHPNTPALEYPYPEAPDIIRRKFSAQKVMKLFNTRLERIEPGLIEIGMDLQTSLTQQDGYLHAGVVTTLLDSACGFAALSMMPEGSRVLSVEFKVNLMAPANGQRFLARGEVIKSGRTLTVCRGELLSFMEDTPSTAALMQATMMRLPGKPTG